MAENGETILKLMGEIRKICMQIAQLLGTADQLFEEHGWLTANSTTVTGGNSVSLNKPKEWVPEFYCRFYTNKKLPIVLLYIAVILDNRENNENYAAKEKDEFDEPLLTSGYFVHPNKDIGIPVKHRCRWHVYSEDPHYNGNIYETIPGDDWGENEKDFDKLRSLAFPLVSVKNSDELKSKVVDLIINDMKSIF